MLPNVKALNVIRRRGVYNSTGNHFAHFKHGAHEPEVVMYHNPLHLAGLCKQLCCS